MGQIWSGSIRTMIWRQRVTEDHHISANDNDNTQDYTLRPWVKTFIIINYKIHVNTVTLRHLKHIHRQLKVRRVHDHAYVGRKDARARSSRNCCIIHLVGQWKTTQNTLEGHWKHMENKIVESGQESTTGTSNVWRKLTTLFWLRVLDCVSWWL
jgi:hypothetical protein